MLPHHEEQKTVRLILGMHAQGLSGAAICRRLDELGRDRRGKRWTGAVTTVRSILHRYQSDVSLTASAPATSTDTAVADGALPR